MRDPKGPVKSYKTPKEIAAKHNVPLDKIIQQVKMGTKVEGEHTTSKGGAKITALQHVDELPDYYSKLKKIEKIKEGNLHQWFKGSSGVTKTGKRKPGWVQPDGSPCANEPGETKTPKCFSSSKLASMSKSEVRSAVRRKRQQDPGQQQKTGAAKPTYVSTDKPEKKMNEESDVKGKGSGEKDACYHKVKARFKVWPSAYASGALVKCRQKGAKNWGNKSEEVSVEQQYEKDTKYCLLCRKNETRSECSYGPQMWDRYSIAKIHPTNESRIHEDHKEIASGKMKDDEGYMANLEMDKMERCIDILRKIISKPDHQLPAWVQSKITRAADFIDSAAEYLSSDEVSEACWQGYKQVGMKKKGKKMVPNCVPANEDTCLTFSQFMAEVAAWQRKEGKNPSGGLNEKGRKSYERENPGSDLKAPQPEGGPRKRSFCARMGGMPGPMKDEKGRPTRKALALRKWKC
jgi:hypothetical protein